MFLYYLVGTGLLVALMFAFIFLLYGYINFSSLQIQNSRKEELLRVTLGAIPVLAFLSLALMPDIVVEFEPVMLVGYFLLGLFTLLVSALGIAKTTHRHLKRQKVKREGRVVHDYQRPFAILVDVLYNAVQVVFTIVALTIWF